MPRAVVEDSDRFGMRIPREKKARLVRAATIEGTDLTEFVLRNALQAAETVIERAERVALSERDTRLWFDLLDNPPKANDRLIAAAKALPSPR